MGKASHTQTQTMMVNNNTNTNTKTQTQQIPTKKKKGRPSLIDLQNRALLQKQKQKQKQQKSNPNNPHFPQNPNRRTRSTRRIPNFNPEFIDFDDDDDDDDDDFNDDDERLEKKVKLVRRLPSSSSSKIDQFPNSSNFNSTDFGPHFNNASFTEDEKGTKATDTSNGTTGMLVADPTGSTAVAAPSTTSTPLPDKKLLLLILDRLQKKDTRGVFAEPVDPEELPDYHEVIENPMDFSTVRKKLLGGVYTLLEQLQADIYLISSNAMEYNPPSSIFFRQARSIQELAKKEFETLRQEGVHNEAPPKPRRGRPPGSRNLKKLLESSSLDHGVRESSAEATPASREDDATKSNSYNLRKGPSLYRFPRNLEAYFDSPASASKSVSMKYGNKQFESDESRRETYNLSGQFESGQDPSLLPGFGGFENHLIPVGLDSNHSYARSLAQYAADLGPVVWRVVSKKIKSVLPQGVEFGPGWVSENKVSSMPLSALPDKPDSVLQDTFTNESHYPSTSGFTNPTFAGKPSACSNEMSVEARGLILNSEWSSLKGINGVMVPSSSSQIQQGSIIDSQGPVTHSGMNGFSGGYGSGFHFQESMARPTASSFNTSHTPKFHPLESSSLGGSKNFSLSRMQSSPVDLHGAMNTENDLGAHGMPYWQNLSTQGSWDRPYLGEPNMGFQLQEASSSRNPSLPIGSPPQLDLVLQL